MDINKLVFWMFIGLLLPVYSNAEHLPNRPSMTEGRPQSEYGGKSSSSAVDGVKESTKAKVSRIMGDSSASTSGKEPTRNGSASKRVVNKTSERVSEILSPNGRSKGHEVVYGERLETVRKTVSARADSVINKSDVKYRSESESRASEGRTVPRGRSKSGYRRFEARSRGK
jgi:hypothetical protein